MKVVIWFFCALIACFIQVILIAKGFYMGALGTFVYWGIVFGIIKFLTGAWDGHKERKELSQEIQEVDKVICPNCGAKNFIDRDYCISCNSVLFRNSLLNYNKNTEPQKKQLVSQKESQGTNGSSWRCSCGFINTNYHDWCKHCYKSRKTVEEELDRKKVKCHHCGATNNKENTLCFACNLPMNPSPSNSTQKNTSDREMVQSFPHAIKITEVHDLYNHFGKFVELTIDDLKNWDAVRLWSKYSDALTEEEAKNILAKPLTELYCETRRNPIRVKIEPISAINAKAYEDSHRIYGILRRSHDGYFVLTSAFVAVTDNNLQFIADQLKTQGMYEYSILDDGTISISNFFADSIENLEIPEKIDGKVVSVVAKNAFRGQDIKSLTIPNTVKRIEHSAFSACNKLESVSLGDGVESLDVAFEVCQELKKVYIGKALRKVNKPFYNCHKITSFDVDPDNPYLCAIDGVLFSKDKNTLVLCPCGKSGKYTIPSGTKIIGENAFVNSDLEEIVIPNTVEIIEHDAFECTDDIKRLIIPSSVKEIAYNAISALVGDYEGEIVVDQGSYAQNYFQRMYEDGEYKLTVLNKSQEEKTYNDKTDKLFCRRCGAQLPLDSDFCFKCGVKVAKNVTEE